MFTYARCRLILFPSLYRVPVHMIASRVRGGGMLNRIIEWFRWQTQSVIWLDLESCFTVFLFWANCIINYRQYKIQSPIRIRSASNVIRISSLVLGVVAAFERFE